MPMNGNGTELCKPRDTSRHHGGKQNAARWLAVPLLVLAFSAMLAACDLAVGSSCPIDDASFCSFVEELEPLVEGLNSNGVLDRTELECCKGNFAWPDEEGYDPQAECIRSGTYRGESACLTDEQFRDFLIRHAPLSVDHLVHTAEVFSELSIDIGETAILVSTGDPEWFLVIFAEEDSGGWNVTAILQIRREALSQFPDSAFVSWPPDLDTPNPPPGATEGVG